MHRDKPVLMLFIGNYTICLEIHLAVVVVVHGFDLQETTDEPDREWK